MGKDRILPDRCGPYEIEEIKIKGPGIELSLPPADLLPFCPDQKVPEPRNTDARISPDNLVKKSRREDFPSIGPNGP
jgi:hypothetical protein